MKIGSRLLGQVVSAFETDNALRNREIESKICAALPEGKAQAARVENDLRPAFLVARLPTKEAQACAPLQYTAQTGGRLGQAPAGPDR